MENFFNPSQCVGFAAMILGIISYQFNDRKKLLIIQAVMGLLWTVSFYLLGKEGFTGDESYRNGPFFRIREQR